MNQSVSDAKTELAPSSANPLASVRRLAVFVALLALAGGISFGASDPAHDALVPLFGLMAAGVVFYAIRAARGRNVGAVASGD